MVCGIVERIDGHICASSHPCEGTTFRLLFPRIQAPTSDVLAQRSAGTKLTGVETVPVVDDGDVARNLTLEFVASYGYVVLAAKSGREAVGVARGHPAPIHLLLTDIVMPKMSGTALAKRFVAVHPETKVIYMTSYADVIDIQGAGVGNG